MMSSNGARSSMSVGESQPGISEELLSILPENSMLLYRPLSKESIREVIEASLLTLRKRFLKANIDEYKLKLFWTPELVKYLQEFNYNAEENAASVLDVVSKIVENTIFKAIFNKKLQTSSKIQNIGLDVNVNDDGTANLVFLDSKKKLFDMLIEPSLANKKLVPVDFKSIETLMDLPARLKKHVIGAEDILERLGMLTLVTEDARNLKVSNDNAKERVRAIMALGMTSTGKTETAKALARELYGSESALITIDCGHVKTVHDLKVLVLGLRDHYGEPIASDFMKHFDRNQGRLLVVLDELAKVPKEITTALLYDILREPVVRTFSDGKPRQMGQVTLIMTGNAGEEWFADIPRDIPMYQQMVAMKDIYDKSIVNSQFKRQFLENYFTEAFITRVGEKNIFFYSPLFFRAIRELALMKVLQSLDRLKPENGRRGWNVRFLNEDSFIDLIETIEEEGFVIREQGASIDRFVAQEFEFRLRHLLLTNQVPSASDVIIGRRAIDGSKGEGTGKITFKLMGQEIELPGLEFKQAETPIVPKTSKKDTFLTSFHEAGHEILREIFLGDVTEPDLVSVIPGVIKIEDKWILYSGIAKKKHVKHYRDTKSSTIQLIAGFLAGEVAESLVTVGRVTSSGKANDTSRATEIIKGAILSSGLSDAWGIESLSSRTNINEVIASFSEKKKKLLEKEVGIWLKESRELAKKYLLLNFDTVFLPLSKELVRKGTMNGKELKEFYKEHVLITPKSSLSMKSNLKAKLIKARSALASILGKKSRDATLLPWLEVPTDVMTIEKFVDKVREEEISKVELPKDIPVEGKPDSCKSIMKSIGAN